MRGENLVFLLGRLGGDPELKYTNGGTAYANVSLATDESYKDKNGEFQEQTEWHNIVCWRLLAERAEKFVKKGSQLFVEGRLRSRSWEDKTGQARYTVEIVADTLQILGRKQDEATNQQIQLNIQEIIPR